MTTGRRFPLPKASRARSCAVPLTLALLAQVACGVPEGHGPLPSAGTGGGTGGGWAPAPDVPCEAGDRYEDDTRACYCVAQDAWTCVDGSNPGGDDVAGVPLAARFDFLFVLDDSAGMAGPQRRLAQAMDAFAARLDALDMDYTVSVVTTSGGASGACPAPSVSAPAPVTTSCRERLGAFVPGPGAPTDPASACTDVCTLDTLELTPGLDGASGDLAALTRRAGALNTEASADPAQVLRCMIPQGNSGCDFVQPLAATGALLQAWREDLGFFPGMDVAPAGAGAILVTDGIDCSAQDPSIFDPQGARTFWSDPQASAPTPAVCWNAGVSCEGGPGSYDTCAPADLDASGAPSDPADAALAPAADAGARLRDDLVARGRELLVLGGVPVGYPEAAPAYADASDPTEQDQYGIGPGCTGDDTRAQPPVRLMAAADAWSELGGATVASICEDDLSSQLVAMVERLEPQRTVCETWAPADVDPDLPGVQPLCFFEGQRAVDGVSESFPIPRCLEDKDGGWSFPSEGDDLCVRMFVGDQLPAHCTAEVPADLAFAFRVERRPGASYGWSDSVVPWCLLP